MSLYTTSQAAKVAGVSTATIRNVTTGKFSAPYAGLWSPGVTPGTGSGRLFTEEDLRMLRYIRGETNKGRSHASIAADIRNGALDDFAAQEEEPGEAQGEESAQSIPQQPDQAAALVVYGAFQALEAQLSEARERETQLAERLIESEGARRAAEREAELLRAQLAERRRGFWSRLTGR